MAVVVRWLNSAHADEFFGLVLKGVDGCCRALRTIGSVNSG